MDIVIAVAAEITKYTIRPVGQWLCYSCHYKSNMENLKELEKTLRDAKNRVQHDVDTASNNGDEIHNDVKTWLSKVDGIIHQLATKELGGGEEEEESRNSNASCLNLKQRHQISREAKEMVDNITKLLKEKPNLVDGVSYRPAAQEIVTPTNVDYMTLDSRILITKRIMAALGDANINKIGVWGSPGVGKSTLMKEIFKKAKEESFFDEVAKANVTDSPNLSRIQEEIADMLDLKLDPNCKTEMVRAGHLRARLEKDKEKKILVILDDIWKRLDLEEIGIIPSERCKVLLTSRDRHVLSSEMVTEENNFKLDILGEQEAWNLFEKMAGDSVKDDLDLRNEAIKVATACGGLPIALVTVSRALKDHKNLKIWKDALEQLTRPPPEHDTEIWSPVYTCIQLSYKHLVGRELQSLFLLCARQGYYISYRDLLRYGFSLCLFHGIHTLDGARNRLEYLVSKLQDACLLLQSPRSSEEFYMHDVVRHVATIIASNDHNMFVMRGDGGPKTWPNVDSLKRCEALSIHGGEHIHKYHNKIESPKLRYFHVQCKPRYPETPSSSLQGMDKLEDIFFQGMEKLEVLSLTNIQLSSLLPLANLQTLCLDGCKLEDIHWIGKLKTLVILSLAGSDISNLPGEIGSLTGLRLLDLTNCSELKVIPPNVLSSLVKLEELYMRNIKVQWEVEGPNNEGKNASLAELKHLSDLITLEIDIIEVANKLPKDLFSKELERYKIRIGDGQDGHHIFYMAAFSRTLELKLNMSNFQLDFGIKMLLKGTEYLYLDESNSTKSVLYELDREDFQQLKHLHIQNNDIIMHLPELRTSFKYLKVLEVDNCEKLRFIFSLSIARGLSLLEELRIRSCNNLGAIFVKEEEDHGIEEVFCRLQTLELWDLPKLVSFLSTRETNSEGNNHDLQVLLLHHQLSFPSLKELHLQHLPKIKHVWSNVNGCESLKSLTHLKSLKITNCGVLEEIVQREDGIDPTSTRLLLPNLTLLSLDELPKLKWFFQGVCTLESSSFKELHEQGGTLFRLEELSFPSLQSLRLGGLPRIKHVWSKEIFRFPDLLNLHVARCENLKSLFPAAVVATSLTQLKYLEMRNCKVLEEIVQREDGTDPTTRFLLTSLTLLSLDGLPKLKRIFQGVRTLESSSSKELHEQGGTLFRVNEFSFPSLKTLQLEGLPKIKHVWSKEIFRFPDLLDLYVARCENLKSLFPAAAVATSLTQLKSLKIRNCEVLEEIVQRKDGTDPTTRILFTSLTLLSLDGLPKLKRFFQGVRTLESSSSKELHEQGGTLFGVNELSFPSLKELHLQHLPKIKHVWSNVNGCESLKSLTHLKSLKITNCGVLEEIVQREDGLDPTSMRLLFPILTLLSLDELPKLKWFFQGVRTLESSSSKELHEQGGTLFWIEEVSFPSLRTLHMKGLPKIKHVWSCGQEPKTVFRCLEQLKILEIDDCGVEEIVAGGGGEAVAGTILELPRVTNLTLIDLKRLKWFYKGVHVSKWPMLEEIWISGCEKVEIFASGVVRFEETVEERPYEMSIKQPLFLVDELSFSSLKMLLIENMDKLEIIWQDQVAASSFSKNIQDVEIHNCEKLLHVFQSNSRIRTILTQRLTRLFIWGCSSLETIFRNMEGHTGKESQVLTAPSSRTEESVAREDGTARHIEFPTLTQMTLVRLPKLKWILEGMHTNLECPSLEILELWECEQVIWASKFASSSSSQETSQQNQLQTCIQLPLPNLLELELGICHVKLPSTSFKKLRVLKLENCEKLRFVFSSFIASDLSLLEKLEIRRCNNMGAIVVKEEKDGIEDGDVILFHQLQTLVLEDLPELVSFLSTRSSFMIDCRQIIAEGNHDLHMPLLHHQVSFPSLQTLRMKGLPKIKHVWSCGQEPKTVFNCLEQLKIVEIEDCEVEEIVAGGGGEAVARTILEFPRVTYLQLRNLKTLKWFYKGVSKWPMLKNIWIRGCEKVEIFASGVVSFEKTVEERSSEMPIKQPLFLVDELSFSSLKKLFIENMDKLEIIWHVFQSNFLTTTILSQRLTRLWISNCRSLETIFRNMEGHNGKEPQVLIAPSSGKEESVAREDGTARHIEFPILTQMRLCGLPKLKWILEGVHTNLECPSLKILQLLECEQVLIWASKFASSSSSQETRQQNQLQTCIQLPLPNLLELQVGVSDREEIFPYELVDPVPRLRRLQLDHLPMLAHLWKEDSTQPCPLFHNLEFLSLSECGKLKNIVPSSVFLQNLTEFYISCCDGLINLLTSSTAKTLVQLQKMTVKNCKRITEIVAMEDGEEHVAITFNKLAHLELENLPNLTHFCSGPYSFGESLKNVIVKRCPEMKPLCHGVSSTPELKGVYHT